MAIPREKALEHLDAVLSGPQFKDAGRLGPFLRHLVVVSLDGESSRLKESVLGLEFFQRGSDYDPRLDPVVRVEARRLRQRLEEYYAGPGARDSIRISLPKGGYVPLVSEAVEPANGKQTQLRWRAFIAAGLIIAFLGAVLYWRRGSPPPPADPAEIAYRRGVYQANIYSREAMERAITYFNEALALRPDYAPALAASSQVYAVLAYYDDLPPGVPFDMSRTLAEKAVAADPNLAETHAAMGFSLGFHQWRWKEAEASFRKALGLNPSSSLAHGLFGVAVLLPQARFDEALVELRRSLELEPNSSFGNFVYGFALLASGSTKEAVTQYKRTLELGTVHHDMAWDYGMALGFAGEYKQAQEAFKLARRVAHEPEAPLRGLEAFFAGNPAQARADVPGLEKRVMEGREDRMDLVRLCAMLGETEKAIQWLERAVDAREREIIWLKSDPRLRSLRSHPRFSTLAARIGL